MILFNSSSVPAGGIVCAHCQLLPRALRLVDGRGYERDIMLHTEWSPMFAEACTHSTGSTQCCMYACMQMSCAHMLHVRAVVQSCASSGAVQMQCNVHAVQQLQNAVHVVLQNMLPGSRCGGMCTIFLCSCAYGATFNKGCCVALVQETAAVVRHISASSLWQFRTQAGSIALSFLGGCRLFVCIWFDVICLPVFRSSGGWAVCSAL
jgi:hypothetical protein